MKTAYQILQLICGFLWKILSLVNHDVSNNISNKFSNIFKRKSQKISFFEEKYAIFSVFIRFHYSKGIPYKDGVAGSSPVPPTENSHILLGTLRN